MKVLCATSCGRTLMSVRDGVFPREALDTHLGMTYPSPSIDATGSGLIARAHQLVMEVHLSESVSCRDLVGVMSDTWSQFSLLPIIAIVVGIRPPFLSLMRTCSKDCIAHCLCIFVVSNLIPHLGRGSPRFRARSRTILSNKLMKFGKYLAQSQVPEWTVIFIHAVQEPQGLAQARPDQLLVILSACCKGKSGRLRSSMSAWENEDLTVRRCKNCRNLRRTIQRRIRKICKKWDKKHSKASMIWKRNTRRRQLMAGPCAFVAACDDLPTEAGT